MAPFGAKFVPNFIPSDQGDQNGHSLDRGTLHVEMLGKKCGNLFFNIILKYLAPTMSGVTSPTKSKQS